MNEEHSMKTIDDRGNERIPFDTKKSFEKVLKRGIYKQLYDKKMISDSQLNILLQNEVMWLEYQTPLRVAAYARVSTEKEDQMHSLESQRSYFAQYINAKQNMQLTKIYYDEGISGTQIRNRIGFQQMIEDALQGRFNLILTKEVSRFARNTVDTLAYTRKLKEAGVGIIFTIDHIDTREQEGE